VAEPSASPGTLREHDLAPPRSSRATTAPETARGDRKSCTMALLTKILADHTGASPDALYDTARA
jgi:hypothetical protein